MESKVSDSNLEFIAEKIREKLFKKDADTWTDVQVSNWILVNLGLPKSVASNFRNHGVDGGTLVKGFKDELDLDAVCPQVQARTLIFKEKENIRKKLEIMRGEVEEQQRHNSDVFISYSWTDAELVRSTAQKLSSCCLNQGDPESQKL